MLDLRIIQFYHYLGHHITHRLPLSLSMGVFTSRKVGEKLL
jgi:hypothetical protein